MALSEVEKTIKAKYDSYVLVKATCVFYYLKGHKPLVQTSLTYPMGKYLDPTMSAQIYSSSATLAINCRDPLS